ncbi:hypothetical protein C7S16_4991 [Burkholderia thailandensis]|uniref:Secreted protein n=1 Tax=Burkholderia thailandensis TaxID=57975 RepID=A0AAW9CQY0_BURTH|nr:hypothetical protein [Burkholderia thailandensis]MDW9252016.1 hypothetical protein [Burkholderia thailandensis]
MYRLIASWKCVIAMPAAVRPAAIAHRLMRAFGGALHAIHRTSGLRRRTECGSGARRAPVRLFITIQLIRN